MCMLYQTEPVLPLHSVCPPPFSVPPLHSVCAPSIQCVPPPFSVSLLHSVCPLHSACAPSIQCVPPSHSVSPPRPFSVCPPPSIQVTVLRRKNRHQSNSSGLSTASGSSLLGKVPPEPRTTSLSVLSSSTSETSYSATVVLRQQEQRGGSGIHDRLRRRMSSVFSSDSARKKWRNFERKVSE